VSLTLTVVACQTSDAPNRPAADGCVGLVGEVLDLDWAPDATTLGILTGDGGATYAISTFQRGGTEIREVIRGHQIVSAGMAAAPGAAVLWQESVDGQTVLVKDDAGARSSWVHPRFGFEAIEFTDGPVLATEVVAIGSGSDEMRVVEVDLRDDGEIGISELFRRRGVESLAATADGETVATAGQLEVAGALFVHLIGTAAWSSSVDDGWPGRLAIAPDGAAVLITEASNARATWLSPDGALSRSVLGDLQTRAFDLARDGALAYATDSEICVVSGGLEGIPGGASPHS
jgi:hypothetical protein